MRGSSSAVTTTLMLPVRVIMLPSLLSEDDVSNRSVVVFDVLRATTTIAAAISAGANEVRVFASLDEARDASRAFGGSKLLAGEHECLPPADFDLGNSPGDYRAERVADRTIFMSTTNGTRVLHAARRAAALFTGASVNAHATARALIDEKRPVTLLCAGTRGQIALEDLQGCGIVIDELGLENVLLENDSAQVALAMALSDAGNDRFFVSAGGRNIRAVNLQADISYAMHRNLLDIAVRVQDRDGVLVATQNARYA